MENALAILYKSPKTVFTISDIALIWSENKAKNLRNRIRYYVNTGALIRLTRGVFAKDKNYNPKELATSIYTPSYISFETVLREAGMIFQHYETLYVASYNSKVLKVAGRNFCFRKIKNEVLYNTQGIVDKGSFSQASPERAFLDTIYLYPRYYFDNLNSLDWDVCQKLVGIYHNQQLAKRLEGYRKKYAE